jgi:hypothetical protein
MGSGSSIRASLPWGRGLDQLGEVLVGVGQADRVVHRRHAEARDLRRKGLAVVDHVMGAQVGPSLAFGRDAVAITVRSVRWRASWIRIDPAAGRADDEQAGCVALTGQGTCRRSNSSSQAVMPVSGRAAASAAERLAGLRRRCVRPPAGIPRCCRCGRWRRRTRPRHPGGKTGPRPHLPDDAYGVIAQHLVFPSARCGAPADLGIHRIHRNGLHLHQQIAAGGHGREVRCPSGRRPGQGCRVAGSRRPSCRCSLLGARQG